MSKIGNAYLMQMERQFGDVNVSPDTLCSLCGECYGDHMGLTCPPKECPICGKPSDGSLLPHKKCANKENMISDIRISDFGYSTERK